jgi:Tat protein translocase TatB subunit
MELLLIVVLALIVFGPQRLPEIMGQVGKAIADFRRATSQLSEEFNQTIQSEINQTRATLEEPLNETRAALNDATSVTSPSPSPPPPAASPAEPGQAVGSEGMAAAIGATAGSNSADQWNWEAPISAVPAAVANPASSNSNATSNANASATPESSASTTSPPPATDAKPPADVPPPATEPSRDELLPPY